MNKARIVSIMLLGLAIVLASFASCRNPLLSGLTPAKSVTVTFNSQGGSSVDPVTVEAGSAIEAPESPILAGWAFSGWYASAEADGEAVDFPYTVSADVTFYAGWTQTVSVYTVTFDSQGGTAISSIAVSGGVTITSFTVPTRTGFHFGGWFQSSDCQGQVVSSLTVEANVVLYAKWIEQGVPVSIVFDAQGGSAVSEVVQETGTTIDESPLTTREGYDFGGWFLDQECVDSPVSFPYQVTEAAILYAKWTAQSNVILVTGISLAPVSLNLSAGTSAKLTATIVPSDATNRELVWSVDAPSVATVIDGTVTAVAAGSATVTVTGGGGLVLATCAVTVTAAPVRVTDVSLSPQNAFVYVGDSLDLTAVVSPTNATNKALLWHSGNTGVATVSQAGRVTAVSTGEAVITVTTEDGGHVDSCVITAAEEPIPVTAILLEPQEMALEPSSTGTLTATIYPENATDQDIQWSTDDGSIATVSNGVVTAVALGTTTINASSANGVTASCSVTVGDPGSIVAMTFDSQGGSAVAELTAVVGDAVDAPVTPERDGYTFGGWYLNAACTGSSVSFPYTMSADITVYAKWTETVQVYTVTFDSLGGTSVNTIAVSAGVTITAFAVPGKAGYSFGGWYTSPLCLGSPVTTLTVTSNVLLFAKWVPDGAQYTVTFNPQGGTAVDPVTQDSGTTIDASPVTTRTDYVFGGWFTTTSYLGSPVSFPYTVTADVTLYAKWTPANSVVDVTGVALTPETLTLTNGTSSSLTATISPSDATNKALSWSSSDPAVATVSNGTVSAVAVGTATITVTTDDGGFTDTCEVTVNPSVVRVTGVEMNVYEMVLDVGAGEDVNATVSPVNATNKSVLWTSTDDAVATVDQDGYVTAIAPGTATITVATVDGNFTDSCDVSVNDGPVPVSSVSLAPATLSLRIGAQSGLAPTVLPTNATDKTLTWSTSNASVATVSGGTVTAVAAGAATITATSANGKTGTCAVTVPSLASLAVTSSAATVAEGSTVTLTATATYSDGTTAIVAATYAVNDETIATVSGSVVTGVKADADPVIVTGSWTEGGVTKTGSVEIGVRYDAGIRILVAQSLGYDLIHYWDCSNIADYPNTTWPGIAMGTSGTDYIYEFDDANAVMLLITKANQTKLCPTDMTVSAKGVYRVTSAGIAPESYITDPDDITIYVAAPSAPKIWAWEYNGNAITSLMGYTWLNQPTMAQATGLNYNVGWYMLQIPGQYLSGGKEIYFSLNSGAEKHSGMMTTFWYDGTTFYSSDPTEVPDPVAPTVSVKPASGDIPLLGSITLSYTDGYDAANISVTATINSLSYDEADFTNGSLTVPVSAVTTTPDTAINVSLSATNSVGNDTQTAALTARDIALDKFTWDNALVYFVLTDRFNNGNSGNDYSYYRTNHAANSSVPDVATFHGGDIAGLTAKIDYLDDLGVNAIWITAPYEQAHGWAGGKNNAFPHYPFHGYYTQDWTFMDKNMGTISEFRAFVNAAHERGIRVVMDVVMNHTGYATVEDMITYGFGKTSVTNHGWLRTDGIWNMDGYNDYTSADWGNWWQGWVRAFGGQFGFAPEGSGDLTGAVGYLPDVVTEATSAYTIPTFLQAKWTAENNSAYDDWRLPAAAGLRQNLSIAPAVYITRWLAAWVEEFGVDGFRVDTAKHVDMYRWGELKDAAQAALESWRASSRSDGSVAKTWDEDFWMTGECFGWNNSVTGDYYTTGKFDSMINFHFQPTGNTNGVSSGSTPTTGDWSTLAGMINGSSNTAGNNMLSYISSHDTGLHRPADMKNVATMTVLLPGGVQIFYGDELARPFAFTDCGDSDMMTRGDMNWTGYDASTLEHWQKLGQFRERHPAVGAGTQETIDSVTFGRSYSGSAGDDTVVIKLGTGAVNVTGFFADGTAVRNAYDGVTGTVSGGSVTFTGSVGPILVELAE